MADARTSPRLAFLRRGKYSLAVATLSLSILGLVVLSPWGLNAIDDIPGVDWSMASDIGQAYGAISALLSALALAGVSISVLLQSREALLSRRQVAGEIHTGLMKMAMSDPVYMDCWGPSFGDLSHEEESQLMYVNLIISYWVTLWEMRDMSEAQLRESAKGLFRSVPGQRFWAAVQKYDTYSKSSRMDRFREIIDDAYRDALKSGKPITRRPAERADSNTGIRSPHIAGAATGAFSVAIGGLIVRQLMRRRRG